jgi:hypothetical protein
VSPPTAGSVRELDGPRARFLPPEHGSLGTKSGCAAELAPYRP